MKSFISYLKNVRGELSHVVWPKPRQAALHTVLIILISVIVAVLAGVLDFAFTRAVEYFVTR